MGKNFKTLLLGKNWLSLNKKFIYVLIYNLNRKLVKLNMEILFLGQGVYIKYYWVK